MKSAPVLSRPFVEAAAAFVARRTGLAFSEARRSAFEAALEQARLRGGGSPPEVYLARLDLEPALLDDLVAEITVGETYFFREPEQWTVIRDQILPTLLQRRTHGRPLRLWSAGCASGEEPYTLAIVMRQMGLENAGHIVGTDLSRAALSRAHRGLYSPWSFRSVPKDVIRSFFVGAGNRLTPIPAVRDAVEFRYLNLAEDTYPSLSSGIWGMDLILCRNVLIYFNPDTIVRVARRLIDSLSLDGWLLLSSSDPILSDLVPCEVVVTTAGLAYRRVTAVTLVPNIGLPAATPISIAEAEPEPEESSVGPLPLAAIQIAPSTSDDQREAVRRYATRDYSRAAESADRATHHDGADPAIWVVLVRSLANQGQLDAAGRACAAGLDRHRASAELTYLHAVLLTEAGHSAEATAALRQALYLDRSLVVAHLALGSVLVRSGEIGSAHRAFGNAEELLAKLPPEAIVPASDGEPAGRLLEMARMQIKLLPERAA